MVHLTSHSETQNSDGRINDYDAGFLVFDASRLVQSGIGHSKSVPDIFLILFFHEDQPQTTELILMVCILQ